MSLKSLFRKEFRPPIVVLVLLIAGALSTSSPFWIAAIILGMAKVALDSYKKIRQKIYSLDYIALLAMAVSLFAHQYLAGAVVALMITGGEALDEYASMRAESALRGLAERIPKFCAVRKEDKSVVEKPIQEIEDCETIII